MRNIASLGLGGLALIGCADATDVTRPDFDEPARTPAVREVTAINATGQLAANDWVSLPALDREWTYFLQGKAGWEGDISPNQQANVITVTAKFYKIRDGYPDRDFYLAYVKTHHQANARDADYKETTGYCDDGYVGWYASSRELDIKRSGGADLLEYAPTGTQGGQYVSVGIGADLNTGAVGVNANFSTTYYNADVTTEDHSSMLDDYASWSELFRGPSYTTGACPFCVWSFSAPSAVGRSSWYSEALAVFQTGWNGAQLQITTDAEFSKDKVDWDFCVLADVFSVETQSYSLGGMTRWVGLNWNFPAQVLEKPSAPAFISVNLTSDVVAHGEDFEGNPVQYQLWVQSPNGSVGYYPGPDETAWGGDTFSLTWQQTGPYNIRARVRDDFAAPSPWSEYTTVQVSRLMALGLAAPDLAWEGEGATLECSAEVWEDGAAVTQPCDPGAVAWSVDDETIATISPSGTLTPLAILGDQTVLVTLAYTVEGLTLTRSHTVTVRDEVDIGGLYCQVPNVDVGGGQRISDRVAELGAEARNHGQFVSRVTALAKELFKAGIITGKDQGKLVSCAARAPIP